MTSKSIPLILSLIFIISEYLGFVEKSLTITKLILERSLDNKTLIPHFRKDFFPVTNNIFFAL